MVHLQEALINLEPVLLLLALVAFVKSGSVRRLPALTSYLVIRLVSLAYLQVIFRLGGSPPQCGTPWYTAYFFGYWIAYIAAAVAIFFVVQEVFNKVMEPVPGLRRLGLLAFRWVSIVSVVVAFGAVTLPAAMKSSGGEAFALLLGSVGMQMARCVSILELCLLAFLALSIHTLGRSFRSRLFGVGLGFGFQAGAELITSAMLAKYPGLQSPSNLVLQISISVVLLTWTVYFAIPEPEAERNLIVLPPSSVMARWNGLAGGIGQAPTLAPATTPTGFFLQDIEGVVDRVLARNPVAVGTR
ncbi:MAG TPA: hypothetical protein VJV22_21235 [Acidobacteriaceae bacterium]|nr:hypothetical protein [Acidobacteriaceae bacterium]